MIFQWLNATEAEKVAAELADQFAPLAPAETAEPGSGPAAKSSAAGLQDLLRRADTDFRLAHLNFYKKARFANSFKWRLLEKGIEPKTADYVTHSLIVHLSRPAAMRQPQSVGDHTPRTSAETSDLLRRGNKALAGGNYQDAIEVYRSVLEQDPSQPEALNGLGAALSRIGQYAEAEQRLRQAIATNPNSAEANCNLGELLRVIGNVEEAEVSLRRALKLKPNYVEARDRPRLDPDLARPIARCQGALRESTENGASACRCPVRTRAHCKAGRPVPGSGNSVQASA